MNRVGIHSVPRSGSTWLGSIFDSNPNVAYRYQPLFSFTHKSQLSEMSSMDDIQKFFIDILNSQDEFVLQKDAIQKGLVPDFSKNELTHVVYKEVRYHYILENLLKTDSEIKVIGIIRNPCAVINSWLRAPKEFKKELGWIEQEEWRWAPQKNQNKIEEFNGYEKWKEVSLLFHDLKRKFPERFYLLEYDRLLKSTIETIADVFQFCELRMTEQTYAFFNASREIDKSSEAYSVFRKKVADDSWKNELAKEIIDEIRKDLKDTLLMKYLID